MRVTRKELLGHLRRWQDLLRLRDWDIGLRIVRTKWRKFGDIKIDLEEKKAVLLVNHRPYSEKSVNLEELVLHELLHVKLFGMDQMLLDLLDAVYGEDEDDPKRSIAVTQFMVLLESTTEDLTKALLAASGSRRPLSLDRLEREVESELRPAR